MEKTGKEEVDVQIAAPPTGFQKALKVLSWPIAAVTGVFYGHRHARNSIYDTLKGQGEFEVAREKRDSTINAEKVKAQDAAKIKAQAEKAAPETSKELEYTLRGVVGKANREYEKDVSKALHKRGYKWTHEFVGDLSRTEMFETAAIAISAASVALGVVLTIAGNKNIIDRFTGGNQKDAEAQRT
jgi:preprotein translocase subunit SecF